MGYSLFYMSHILFTFSSLFHKKLLVIGLVRNYSYLCNNIK